MNFFNLNLPAKAVLLLGILLIFVSSVRSQSEMIESAKKDYLSGDYSNFSSKMREILDWNIEDPTKEILEGLFLLQDNDLNKRRIAGKLIQKNVPRLRNDPFSDFAMGILYKKQNNHSHAKKYFERAIGKNDRMIAALIELGEYHFREMLKYYNRYTDTEIPMSYRDYALEDYDYAVSYLRRVLRYDPKNKEAAYLLGNLYYEQNEMVYMKQLFQDMLQYYPRDRNLNLFLGLVCLRNREYLEASQYFGNALAVMNDEEKDGFFNPEYLRRDRKDNSHDTLIAHFWSQRDPMFLTGENERLLEHFGRYAYANLRFSVPKLEVEGWKTDRGKTYIRYGRPSYIVEYGKSMELFQGLYPPMQIWVYPEFQLAFSDEFWNGLFQFTQPGLNTKSMFKERTIINYSLVAEDVFRTVPEKFDFSLPGGVFETSYQIKFFKSQEKTEAMLAFSLPVEETLYYPRQKFQAGLFLLNSEKLPFVRFKEDFDLNLERDSSRIIADQLVKSLSFRHTDGTFQYSFEIMNNTLEKNFIDRQKMSIPAYGSDTLMISDIVLADEILPQADSSQIISCYTRNGLNILPNISQYFMQNDTLLVYFELYNLDL
ncbi:MAG: GWxTD domain-containing protein, partial [Calditrichaeota bacterium]